MAAGLLDVGTDFFDFLVQSFLLLAPMLLLGLFLGGLIHVFISRHAITRWFRHDTLKSVTAAAAVGVPIPLCSCSVVPVVAEMRTKGASRSSCMSLLITAPETGADSILVTHAFFGPVAAVVRPVISFTTAVVAGLLSIRFVRGDHERVQQDVADGCCCHQGSTESGAHQPLMPGLNSCYVSPAQMWRAGIDWAKAAVRSASRGAGAGPVAGETVAAGRIPDFRTIVGHVFRYGFVEIADDILFALLVGIVLGAMLYVAIPADLMASEYSVWLSYPVMLLVGVPLYICASASTPIAAALVAKGVSPGAALVFLMTGPATNTGTIAIIMQRFGLRFASIYVGSVVGVTVVCGVLVDILVIASGWPVIVTLQASGVPTVQVLQWAGAFALLALIVWRFRAGAFRRGWEELLVNLRPVLRQ